VDGETVGGGRSKLWARHVALRRRRRHGRSLARTSVGRNRPSGLGQSKPVWPRARTNQRWAGTVIVGQPSKQ
jgi:hypothetical protein